MSAVMKMGKYKGEPVDAVPAEYLAWYAKHIATPADYVVQELERRSKAGGRDGVVAAAALSDLLFRRSARTKPMRRQWRRKLRRNRRGG